MKFVVPALILLLLSLCSASAASAARLYGWELEFGNKKTRNSNYGELISHANKFNDAARERWLKIVKKLCAGGNCRIKEIWGDISWFENGYSVWAEEIMSYRITFNDGFWFQLSYDTGVVEVQLKPSTVEDLKKQQQRIQEYIFDTAKEADLTPPYFEETHIHTGAEAAFGLDLMLIRNFLVDGVNHPEWSYLFPATLENGPPLIELPPSKYETFAKIIKAVDRGEITDLEDFIKQIRKKVYDVTFDEEIADGENNLTQKFQQWNIERMKKRFKDSEKTIENRAVPHPHDAQDVVDLTVLQDARIEYVLGFDDKPIPLDPRPKKKLTRKEQVARFKKYIEEAGQKFATYVRFLKKDCQALLTEK